MIHALATVKTLLKTAKVGFLATGSRVDNLSLLAEFCFLCSMKTRNV